MKYRQKTWIPKILIFLIAIAGFSWMLFTGLGYYLAGNFSAIPGEYQHAPADSVSCNAYRTPVNLKVLTLNIAHGGGGGIKQIFLADVEIKKNLKKMVSLLLRETPHIVALQEADGRSAWSGDFNHVAFLAMQAKFAYSLRGEHVKGLGLSYGTALLSQCRLYHPESHTFEIAPPVFTKGFVLGTILWPGKTDRKIDVVSLHLDFVRDANRKKQIAELVNFLSERDQPLIVLGDFNSEWSLDSPISELANQLNLKGYQRDNKKLGTHPFTSKRIDWILISSEMDFLSYKVLNDEISDHKAVLAELIWRKDRK